MNIIETGIPGLLVIEPDVHEDNRGFFMEVYNQRDFEKVGIKSQFVQENQSKSSYGAMRGLHYQLEGLLPHSEKARKNAGYSQYMYTSFELSDQKYGKYKKLRPASFKDLVGLKFAGNIDEYTTRLSNLPHSYCFKSLHNEFLNDKNQVFTRSLHAEENAMMQMVKFGGEGLMDGDS